MPIQTNHILMYARIRARNACMAPGNTMSITVGAVNGTEEAHLEHLDEAMDRLIERELEQENE